MLVRFFLLLGFLFPLLGHAKYIEGTTQDNVFVQIYGDGMEDGIDLLTSILVPGDFHHKGPVVNIPENDNFSNCSVEGITLIKSDEFMGYESRYYRIRVNTKVLGDTGGCIIIVYHPIDGNTISIMKYDYQTNGL
jgi:hypothetical protein